MVQNPVLDMQTGFKFDPNYNVQNGFRHPKANGFNDFQTGYIGGYPIIKYYFDLRSDPQFLVETRLLEIENNSNVTYFLSNTIFDIKSTAATPDTQVSVGVVNSQGAVGNNLTDTLIIAGIELYNFNDSTGVNHRDRAIFRPGQYLNVNIVGGTPSYDALSFILGFDISVFPEELLL